MNYGTSFRIKALRTTALEAVRGEEVFGDALVRRYPINVTVAPVIETGETKKDYYPDGEVFARYKAPDRFKHFEFELRDRRWWWRGDRRLRDLLEVPCAFEFWTRERKTGYWIHWVFPKTMWEGRGFGRYDGISMTGPSMRPEDFPDNETPLTEGGFFKTTTPPPRP